MTVLPVGYENAVQISGQMLRGALDPLQEGAKGAADLKVAPGAALSVDVPAGVCFVQGDSIFDQGLYRCALDATINSAAFAGGAIPAAHATLPRIDQIIARVYDQDVDGSGQRLWRPEVLAGTATAGATLDNRTGATALPATAMRLCDLLTPAAFAGPYVQATHIRDRRPFARGFYRRLTQKAGGDYSITSTSEAAIDATNLQMRVECTGVPLRVKFGPARIAHNTAGQFFVFTPRVDGAIPTEIDSTAGGHTVQVPSTGVGASSAPFWDLVLAAGSHLITMYARTTAGTGTVFRGTGGHVEFEVQELLRQDVSNTGA